MKYQSVLSIVLFVFLAAACSSPPTSLTQSVAQSPQPGQPTANWTQTPSPLPPTDSPTLPPTATFTLTATATVIPIVQVQVKSEFVIVREGPDEIFGQVATVSAGVILEAVGITVDEAWVLVKIAPNRDGWIATNTLEVGEGYQYLPRLEPPPTPTLTPTPEAVPTITTNKYSYKLGDGITIYFTNFIPTESVDVQFIDSGGVVRAHVTTTITADGHARKYFPNSKYTPHLYPDTYRVVATGSKGSYAATTIVVTD